MYTGLKIPPDLDLPFDKFNENGATTGKTYKEDQINIKNLISNELKEHKELIEEGNGDSSCGSDEEPSEGMYKLSDSNFTSQYR